MARKTFFYLLKNPCASGQVCGRSTTNCGSVRFSRPRGDGGSVEAVRSWRPIHIGPIGVTSCSTFYSSTMPNTSSWRANVSLNYPRAYSADGRLVHRCRSHAHHSRVIGYEVVGSIFKLIVFGMFSNIGAGAADLK